jgi:hypothetical protein
LRDFTNKYKKKIEKLEGFMFCKNDSKSYREILPGIGMKAVVYGENTLMTEFSQTNIAVEYYKIRTGDLIFPF